MRSALVLIIESIHLLGRTSLERSDILFKFKIILMDLLLLEAVRNIPSVRYRAGQGRFGSLRPRHYIGLGGLFCSFPPPRPRPGPDHTHSLEGPLFFTTKNLHGPVCSMARVRPVFYGALEAP